MSNPLVTVVVPVYKVEKTINRCVESLTNQTYNNIEIILVDDGSPDCCPQICDEWAEKDTRIRVIHKQNEGLGMARNTGIENAKGKYICFCDSDDFVSENMIEKCTLIAEKEKLQILHYGLISVDEHLNEVKKVCCKNTNVYSGQMIKDYFIPGMMGGNTKDGRKIGLWMSLCTSFVSLELIKKMKWKCESERVIISEDMYSLLELYHGVEKAGVINECFYYYCMNPASLSHTYREDRYEKIKNFYEMTIKRCESLNYGEECVKLVSNLYVSYTIATIKQICNSKEKSQKKDSSLKLISSDELFKEHFNYIKKHGSKPQYILWGCMYYRVYLFVKILCFSKR